MRPTEFILRKKGSSAVVTCTYDADGTLADVDVRASGRLRPVVKLTRIADDTLVRSLGVSDGTTTVRSDALKVASTQRGRGLAGSSEMPTFGISVTWS